MNRPLTSAPAQFAGLTDTQLASEIGVSEAAAAALNAGEVHPELKRSVRAVAKSLGVDKPALKAAMRAVEDRTARTPIDTSNPEKHRKAFGGLLSNTL